MSSDFVHLHVHTEYSLLDGQSKISKLVERARELDMPAVGITDHGVMFGVIDFFRTAVKNNIKPIIGMEAYLATRGMDDRDPRVDKRPYHMLLLAKNMTGYQNLLKMASEAQLRGYYYRPRIDREFMAAHAEGVIATSGCLAAEIPRMLEEGQEDKARELIGWYKDVFGEENFYLELQPHDIDQLEVLNKWLLEYRKSSHTNVQLLATNDMHYVRKEDTDPHDTLLCIQTGSLKSERERMTLSPLGSYYMKSADEMRQSFKGAPPEMLREAFENSLKIAEVCDVNLDTEGYHLPIFPVPQPHTEGTYLRYLCEKGMIWRFGDSWRNDPVLVERLERELRIISDMGFNTYFLIVWDLCEFARAADIWWNVRGSGAGSLVAYSLGITSIDPIQNSLLFERFLNPGRVSMPDIDLDYPDDRRGEMIAYAAQKYGEDKVAAIITFGTMGAKASVRDVGRVMDVPLAKITQAVSLIPTEARQKKIKEYIELNPELKDLYQKDSELQKVMDTAIELQGMTRHASTHAAGVIISDKPLVEYIPLHRITGTDPSGGALKAVTQFPMETAESIGLLKVDFLGLSTLTILRKACELIERHQGIQYTMENIPYRHDDNRRPLSDEQKRMLDEAFVMMGRGETVGVFQVESGGMQQMLRGMRPKQFENIIAGISLYRPGPMEFIPAYNRRLHDEEEVPYKHEKLKPILAETYGIFVYQEQIMQVAGNLFGYDLGEADLMRRAVSKKKQKALLEHKEIFKQRGPDNGISQDVAEAIFDEIEFFANYGFNKSHASDYAVITVQTAFLKCHYPEEYMTALLTVQRDDSNKVATFLEECRRLEIPILPPDVNFSMLDFDIETMKEGKRGIRFGMAAVKNAGVAALEHIIAERTENGPFSSLEDFCHRVDMRIVGKRALESLIKVGALESLGNRYVMIDALERIAGYSINYHKNKETGQMSMFGEDTGMGGDMLDIDVTAEPTSEQVREGLRWEKELLGLYVSGRPVDKHKAVLRQSGTKVIAELKENETLVNESAVAVAGEVASMRKIITRNGDVMAILHLEDWHDSAGTIDVVLFPRTWKRIENQFLEEYMTLDEGEIVIVRGKVDTTRGDVQIIADTISTNFTMQTALGETSQYDDDTQAPAWADSANGMYEPPDWDSHPVEPPEWALDKGVKNGHSSPMMSPDSDEAPEFDEETGEVASAENTDNSATGLAFGSADPNLNRAMANASLSDPAWMNGNGNGHELASLVNRHTVLATRHLKIYLKRSSEPEKDRRRLRRIHGLLTKYPGEDTFSIIIGGTKKPVEMNFPNHTTGYCPEMADELAELIGEENFEICE